MTDEVRNAEALPEDAVSPDAVDEGIPEVAEKMYDSKTVSKIVERERMKAYEKAKREAMMEQEAPVQQQQQPQAAAPQAPQLGGMSAQDVQAMIAQQLPLQLQEHIQGVQTQHVVDSFVNKMKAAEQRYPGLEQKLNDLDYTSLAPVIRMANELENTGDIMADLVDNPMKLAGLINLAHGQQKLAMKELHNLSNSIKQNQAAAAQSESAATNNPLSQMKPSAGTGLDSGNMSVSDFSKYWQQNKL